MAVDQHKLSRRALLAGVCAGAFPVAGVGGRVAGAVLDSRFRGNDGAWDVALSLYARAVAGLDRAALVEDDDLFDSALGRHNRALARLLGAAAPDLGAVAEKIELMVRHGVFELNFGEAALEALRRDVRGFAAGAVASRERRF